MAVRDHAQLGAILHCLRSSLGRLGRIGPVALVRTLATVIAAVSEPPGGDPVRLADLAGAFRRARVDTDPVAGAGRPAEWSGSAVAAAAETVVATAHLVGSVHPAFDDAADALARYAATSAELRAERRELRARLTTAWHDATHVELFGRGVRVPDVRRLDDLAAAARPLIGGLLEVYRRGQDAVDTLTSQLDAVAARTRASALTADAMTLSAPEPLLAPPPGSPIPSSPNPDVPIRNRPIPDGPIPDGPIPDGLNPDDPAPGDPTRSGPTPDRLTLDHPIPGSLAAGDLAAGTPAADTPTAGDLAAGDLAAGTPAAGTPAAGTPAAGTPAAGTPAAGTPAAGTPAAGTPAAGTPAAGTSAAGASVASDLAAGPGADDPATGRDAGHRARYPSTNEPAPDPSLPALGREAGDPASTPGTNDPAADLAARQPVDLAVLPPWQLLRASRRRAALTPDERAAFERTLAGAGSPLERAYLWKALAAGHTVAAVETFAGRIRGRDSGWLRAHLSVVDPARRGPVTFAGQPFAQTDGTTCGTTSIVVARALADPIYTLEITRDPEAFREEQRRLHGRTNPVWPEALGTSPWGMQRGLAAETGTRYDFHWTDDTKPRERSAAIRAVLAAVDAGYPVPLLVGNTYPAHYLLVVAHDAGALLVYNPAGGRLTEVPADDILRATVFRHLQGYLTPRRAAARSPGRPGSRG
ncbi:hypothetical protein [Cryptosporangium arvum]|uniref:Uncharacterized protein n=1 Tax=Cryptosporangium arvum DSM 44712 TaxID=927661 RepID=A0A010ZV02_9ACTN|nr:hypothetical protein [Cryptosporangium arvum]EXG81037.1 hypothetical protein CryarDRAFT_2132 [Cryptosporangium arvum DSM 44712]